MASENDSVMPLLEHLKELRYRLVTSAIALAIGFFIALGFYDYIIDFLYEPFMQLNFTSLSDDVLFVNTVAEGLVVQLKISVFAGFIFSSPIHIFNIIRFIIPGLLKKERRILAITLFCSFLLVIGSFYYTYYTIIPISIDFLTGHGFIPENTGVLLNFSSNIFYILQFILMAVIVFQLPVILELMMILNVVQRKTLFSIGKYLVVLFFFVAAILSPPDFIT
ncbi:MAG: twin-arginine translocase subunit TatC, partial [Sphaerochaetaceae bacterium]|nr:twin-arginine translocase subunit TatC [Sphaerochaetaceae bacterium]